MRHLLTAFIMLISPVSVAQPATYQDEVFSVPQGAILDADNPAYYNGIQLDYSGDGRFQLVAAQAANLVTVESLSVNIMESFPVQVSVTVNGNKSVPCVDLQTPAIGRQDKLFIIVLAETTLGPAESCIAIIDPFETTISLPVTGLPAETYTVRVNGVDIQFSLDVDN